MPTSLDKHRAKPTLFLPTVSEADRYDSKEALPPFVRRGQRSYVYLGINVQTR